MNDRIKALMERLEAFFQNDEDVEEATIFTGEELGTPMDILRVPLLLKKSRRYRRLIK